jgi:phage shock protein A
VAQTLAALIEEGTGLGDPLVVSTAGAWPEALAEALSRSYPERLERLTAARRAAAAAATLVQDIQDQARELESAKAELEDQHRQAVDAGKPQEAAQAASHVAAAQQQAAELQRLLPTVIEARNRLSMVNQQLQARVDAFRTRKEVLKATYAAAQGSLRVHEAIAASGPAGDDAGEQQEDTGETINPAQAALADVTAQMERELGLEGWPEGLMELRPGAMASADMLRRVRAGQAPEVTQNRTSSTSCRIPLLNMFAQVGAISDALSARQSCNEHSRESHGIQRDERLRPCGVGCLHKGCLRLARTTSRPASRSGGDGEGRQGRLGRVREAAWPPAGRLGPGEGL